MNWSTQPGIANLWGHKCRRPRKQRIVVLIGTAVHFFHMQGTKSLTWPTLQRTCCHYFISCPRFHHTEALQHQAELQPITWAAQMCNGLEKQDRAVLAPPADSVWRPTCLSIGPAPMATAGAESVYNLAAFMRLSPQSALPQDVLCCLRLTVQLTTLARRMAQEAAGACSVHGDEQHIQQDEAFARVLRKLNPVQIFQTCDT
jgi:hypothetical protein